MSDTVKYWIEISDYDLETAKSLLKSKRYLYVGFMCHQAIEKILKAYYVKTLDAIPPYTHRLSYLTEKTGIEEVLLENQKVLIDELEPLNIEARYPKYKKDIYKMMTEEKCKTIIEKTVELHTWIKQKL